MKIHLVFDSIILVKYSNRIVDTIQQRLIRSTPLAKWVHDHDYEHCRNKYEDKNTPKRDLSFSAVREVSPVFDMKRWTGKIMDWAMKHEEFKIGLFRFIDVLPSLKSDDQLIRLLQEYFPREDSVPKIISGGIGMLFGKVLTPFIAGPVIRKSIESMARQFIAGTEANDIKNAINALRKDGSSFSASICWARPF